MDAKLKEIVAQRTALYKVAVERSVGDSGFRARLVAKPRETLDALAKELGFKARVPEGVDVKIVDVSAESLTLVLPPPAEVPLSGSELDRVAGGARLSGSAALEADAHGCPACPHPAIPSSTKR
jgi:hypothetical protein